MSAGGGRRAGYRAALAIHDFRRLTIALVVDAAGSWAYSVVLLVYIFDRTHSAGWVAAMSVVRFLPGLLLSAYAGVIAERYERTAVLMSSALVCFLVMTGMSLVVATDGPIVVLLLLSLVSAAAITPYYPATGALVPQIVDEANLAAANALTSVVENLSVIVGPSLGGLLLLTDQPAAAFMLNGLTFLFSAMCISTMAARSTPSDLSEHGTGVLKQIAVGARALRDLPSARAPVLLSVLATLVYGTDTVLFVPVSHHLDGGDSGYGYLLTAQSVGGLAAAFLINRLASQSRLALSIGVGMAAYCLPTALIPLLHDMAPGLGLQTLRGAGTVVVDVLAMTALQRAVPPHLLSRVLGIFESLVIGAAALGALVVPPLLHAFDLSSTLVVIAVAPPALGLLGLRSLIRIDRESRQRLAELEPRIELLASVEPFEAAPRATLEQLAGAAEPQDVKPGEVVVHEGDPADAFYVVVGGLLEVTTYGEGAAARVVRQLGAGTYFGEIGLLHSIARTATVRAVEPSALLRITADEFRAALSGGGSSAAFLSTAALRLAQTHPVLARSTAGPTVEVS